jgi:hypothetical protein
MEKSQSLPEFKSASNLSWRYSQDRIDLQSGVKADISKQSYCPVPVEVYYNESFTCLDCGEETVFTALEQKHWYEDLEFNLSSQRIRCKKCQVAYKQTQDGQNQICMLTINYDKNKNKICQHLKAVEKAYGFLPLPFRK